MALAKNCLENRESGKHLYFHQAYLTCLYKASLHEHLLKEMAELDGHDAVEIICNTESVEKDDLLLSLCKAFLTQQLHNGDMYYIWDLVFIWSRLHLRAHPSRQGFLAECLLLASSATNVRAVFPFIKLVTTEVGAEGVQVCVELCARALHLCDLQADSETRSLVFKTIAFLLPHDLEICRACALLVFCQERSLEAYRTVCLLYMHPDEEPHPHNSTLRTSVRFQILQMLKDRLCFDPEFWNLLTLRTHCLELMSDKVMKAAVLNEMKEEENECNEKFIKNYCVNDSCTQCFNLCQCAEVAFVNQDISEEQILNGKPEMCVTNNALLKRRKWRRRLRSRKQPMSDDEADLGDDPEFKYNLKSTSLSNKTMYSLRRNYTKMENSASAKLPLNRKREYLSRCVKSQILKRKGRKKRWLQGISRPEQVQTVKEKKRKVKGKKRGRKPLQKLELSYPDNDIFLTHPECGFEENLGIEDEKQLMENELGPKNEQKDHHLKEIVKTEKENGLMEHSDLVCCSSLREQTLEDSLKQLGFKHEARPLSEPPVTLPAIEGDPELDGPTLELLDCPLELLHSYSLKSKKPDGEKLQSSESSELDGVNGDTEQEPQPPAETAVSKSEVKAKRTWKDRVLRTQQYAHLMHHCNFCCKDYKGLNVMRHALSHLKSRKLRCILCGKHFKQLSFAKKHVLDHIDEMCKRKSIKNEPCTKDTTVANGVVDDVEKHNQPEDQNQTYISNEVTIEQKPGGKTKVSSLKREERIIRNLRTLIKKTNVLHKKSKDPDASILRQVDFKDEQVVIKDGLVIVKNPLTEKDREREETEKPAGENGYGVEITYQLCPSESCDRVFLRIGTTLTKHAMKCHLKEEKVLEKTFDWTKHKCTLCPRQLQLLPHYKDHMKLHDTPLQHFCYHLECDQRFLTQQELKDHVRTHKPFKPQCPFTDCEKLFSSLQGLYDHEWRHYIPAPQKEELELGPTKLNQNDEAPWKQRVKVEEIWLQCKKGQQGSPIPDHVETSNVEGLGVIIKLEEKACGITIPTHGEDLPNSENLEDKDKNTINGFEHVTQTVSTGLISNSHTGAAATAPSKKSRKRMPVELDPLNVRDVEDLSTLAEGVQQKLGEPHITEHKTFRPEDPSYATFVKAPFIRPPPSTYLDESLLSMRKRRSTDEVAPKKPVYWSHKKKKEPVPEKEQPVDEVVSKQKIRHRCDKCLSSFGSSEELQKHQALNTCSALFGFDSDDDS
ncbi:Zinc finger protein 292 [Channa argus]|uniref:Zinc finger protein 292 n=2 Tax=Channa argus TaxID=215402 RepID=A0A6G1PXJ6_CHAAH|nr:Zinc finger protein 292 [Channa argus]